MKKLLVIFSVVLLIAIVGLASLPLIFSPESIAEKIQEKVKDATGRDLNFTSAEFVFWPSVGMELKDVTISNLEGTKAKEMVSVAKIAVAVAVRPLFSRTVEIKKFELENPTINLEVLAEGKNNWSFESLAAPEEVKEEGVEGKVEEKKFKFSDVKINGGNLSFVDKDKNYSVNDINVVVSMPDLQSGLKVKGDLSYNGKKITANVSIDKPMDFSNGKASPGIVDLSAENAKFSIKGNLAQDVELIEADVDLDVASIAPVLGWLTQEKDKEIGFKKLKLLSAVTAEEKSITLKNLDVQLDDIKTTGDVDMDFSGKTKVFARLKADKVNVDDIIAKFGSEEKTVDDNNGDEVKKETSADMDFSFIKKFDADLELNAQGFVANGIEIGKSDVKAIIKSNILSLEIPQAEVFDGNFSSKFMIDATNKTPAIKLELDVNGVKAKSVLTKFAEFDKLTGDIVASMTVQSAGNNKEKIISNLKGQGSVTFKNGEFKGIDLSSIAQKASIKTENLSIGSGKTSFVEMGGTFKATKGFFVNNDFKMKGPAVKAEGKGSIDLPRKYLDYYITPTLIIASVKKGKADANIDVPLYIKGPFDNIKVKPDLAVLAKKIISDPKAAKQNFKDVKENIKDQVKDLKNSFIKGNEVNVEEVKTEPVKTEGEIAAEEPKVEEKKEEGNAFDNIKNMFKTTIFGSEPEENKEESTETDSGAASDSETKE